MSVTLRQRKLSSGHSQLFLDIHHSGKRRQEALGLMLVGDRFQDRETRKQAKLIRDKRQQELNEGRHGVLAQNHSKASFLAFCREQVAAKHNPSTRTSYKDALSHLVEFEGEEITFGQLTREFFERFKVHLLGNVSPNSAQIYLVRVKSLITQAVRDNILLSNPASVVTIKKEDRLPTYLTLPEVRKLSDTPCVNDNVRNAFLFACFSGLRYSDVSALTRDQVVDG
jgi:hypothetical protein